MFKTKNYPGKKLNVCNDSTNVRKIIKFRDIYRRMNKPVPDFIKPDFQVIMETYRDLIWDKVKKYSHLIDNPEKTNGIKGPSDPEDKFIGLEYLDWYLKTLPGKGGPQYSRALTASMIWKYDNEFQERIIEIDNLVRQKLGGMDIWFTEIKRGKIK